MKDGDVRVDRCIVKRLRGTFAVEVTIAGVTRSTTTATLEEAQAWRDEQERSRPKREAASYRKKAYRRRDLAFSPEETLNRSERREMLANAPRTKRVINGREFTVVHLPDGPRIPWASFDSDGLGRLVRHETGQKISPMPTTSAGARCVVGGGI